MRFFGMGGKSVESSSYSESEDDDGEDDDDALKQLRRHLATLTLWVAAIRSAPYFISMWEKHGYNNNYFHYQTFNFKF